MHHGYEGTLQGSKDAFAVLINHLEVSWHAEACLQPLFFDAVDDSKGMQYSLIVPYDFYMTDSENPSNIHPVATLSMCRACTQVHCENNNSFNEVMSDKIKAGPFSWKVKTVIKFTTLLLILTWKVIMICLKSFVQTPLTHLELSSRSYVSFMLFSWDKKSHMGLRLSVSTQPTLLVYSSSWCKKPYYA